MTPVRLKRQHVLRAQGVYYVLTGLWPIAHMPSFEAVTGPKLDDWLVKMVGLLAAVIGGTLLLAVQRRSQVFEVLFLAVASALAFGAIDVWYPLMGRISPVYLGDAVVEVALMTALAMTRW